MSDEHAQAGRALFDAALDLFKTSVILFFRTGNAIFVDGRLSPLVVSIAEAAGAMVALADEYDFAPPTTEGV